MVQQVERGLDDNETLAAVLVVTIISVAVLGFVWIYLRALLLAHVVAVLAEPGGRRDALGEVMNLSRGRLVMLSFVAGAPVAIQLMASPTPFAQDLLTNALGSQAAMLVAVAAGFLGWTTAIVLGSALLASAFAVILATPLPVQRTSSR